MVTEKLVKKLSAKTVIGKVKEHLPKDEKGGIIKGVEVALMRVIGLASGIKTGNSTYGEWTAFTGTFKAINLRTGEIIIGATQLFVPEIVEGLLIEAVRGSDGNPVEVAFDIGAVGNDSEVGYEYTARPLFERVATASDPMAQLEARLPSLPALAAPASEPVPETQATPEPEKKGKK